MAQSKLQLIQENRAAGMSYLDAARAAAKSLDVNSDANRLARLEASGQGGGRAAQNLSEIPPASNNTMVDETKFTQSTGVYSKENAQNAITSTFAQAPSQVVDGNKLTIPTTTPVVTATNGTNETDSSINTQGNQSTIKGGSFGTNPKGTTTTQGTIEGQTNQVVTDATRNYEANNKIDAAQYKDQVAAANAKYTDTQTELLRQEYETNELAKEEDRIQKKKAAEDAANMQALQEKERAANEASVAAAQAKADAAERELQIANDIELQKSNVAFAKMGLTLSAAAVTSAQQIYTTGIYNLSKLKSENAFKLADLQVAVSKVEFDHTKVINDIINKSSDKSYEIRKKLNEDIHLIKNSIIDNRFERQKNIDKAIDTYQEAIKANEDEVLNKMNKANAVLQGNVDAFYSSLKVSEGFNQNKIDKYVESGMWGKLSPSERIKLERQAGIAPGTTDSSLRGMVVQNLMKELSDIPGLTSGELTQVSEEAMRLINTGVQRDLAINMALRQNTKYLQSLVKKTKGGGGGSSTTTLNKYTKQIITDPETGIAQIAYFDKTTGVFSHIENMTKDVVVNKTSLDAKSGLAAAGQSLLNGGGIVGAIVAGVSQANKGKTTTPTVQKVPVKMKDITTSDWLVNLNK